MAKIYIVASVVLFILSAFVAILSYVQYDRSVNYWGNEWNGSIWLSSGNKNVADIRLSKQGKVGLGYVENLYDGIHIKFYDNGIELNSIISPNEVSIYKFDTQNNLVLANYSDLVNRIGGIVDITYYKKFSSNAIYVNNIVL